MILPVRPEEISFVIGRTSMPDIIYLASAGGIHA
jgi:hypothetical protein